MEYLIRVRPYLSILRPKNLIIIAVTMSLLQYGVISPLSHGYVALSTPAFILLCFVTLVLAGSANVINDIFDRETDSINKPESAFIGKSLSLQSAWIYYYSLLGVGFVLAIYVGWMSQQWYNLWIYPFVAWGLYMYSRSWKAKPLWGNVVVSLFVAWVWGIVFYAQLAITSPEMSPETKTVLRELCYMYFLFAFLINLIREIVKDMEDIDGDKMSGIKTLPVVFGITQVKQYVIGLILIFLILFTPWLFISKVTEPYEIRFFHLVFIVMPLVLVMTNLLKAHEKKNYSFLSTLLKLIMVFALGGLCIISKNFT